MTFDGKDPSRHCACTKKRCQGVGTRRAGFLLGAAGISAIKTRRGSGGLPPSDATNELLAEVQSIMYLGDNQQYSLRLADSAIVAWKWSTTRQRGQLKLDTDSHCSSMPKLWSCCQRRSVGD